jgi:hypothetical protein
VVMANQIAHQGVEDVIVDRGHGYTYERYSE